MQGRSDSAEPEAHNDRALELLVAVGGATLMGLGVATAPIQIALPSIVDRTVAVVAGVANGASAILNGYTILTTPPRGQGVGKVARFGVSAG
jgi:hypothetical protein